MPPSNYVIAQPPTDNSRERAAGGSKSRTSGHAGPTCPRCGCDVAHSPNLTPTLPAGSALAPPRQGAPTWACSACGGGITTEHRCASGTSGVTAGDASGYVIDDEEDDDDDDDGYSYGYRDGGDGAIHDYGYKPMPVFHGQGPLFLGLELEVATPPDDLWYCSRTAIGWLGSVGYLKSDSSIEHGFEIVTHPMSYGWAIERFPWPMLPALAEDGARATRQTGLHVHLSRDGFDGPCHVFRWLKFLHRNQPAVTALARRASPQWAPFRDDDRRAVKDYAKGRHGFDRYRAINTTNADTFELRVFASSLRPVHVQAALGFAAASVEYTRDLTIPAIVRDHGWCWPAFTAWLAGRPGYRALREQVEVLTCAC